MSGEKGERGRKGERKGGGGETSFPWLVAEPPLRTAAAPRERTGARPRKTRPGCSPRRALGGPGQGRSRASLLAYKELSATLGADSNSGAHRGGFALRTELSAWDVGLTSLGRREEEVGEEGQDFADSRCGTEPPLQPRGALTASLRFRWSVWMRGWSKPASAFPRGVGGTRWCGEEKGSERIRSPDWCLRIWDYIRRDR